MSDDEVEDDVIASDKDKQPVSLGSILNFDEKRSELLNAYLKNHFIRTIAKVCKK